MSHDGKTCPTCGTPWDIAGTGFRARLDELRERTIRHGAEVRQYTERLAKQDESLMQLKEELQSIMETAHGLIAGIVNHFNEDCARLEAERDNWRDTAEGELRNTAYYRDLLDRIGRAIGAEAYVQDDGGTADSVLRAKLPELVERLIAERDKAVADYFEHLDTCLKTLADLSAERDAAIEIAINQATLSNYHEIDRTWSLEPVWFVQHHRFPTVDEARAEVRRLIAERIKGTSS